MSVFPLTLLTYNSVTFLFSRADINHFYVVHENGGLYACSKGRPTKALLKKRLECPEQIEEEVAGLRKDFLLKNKCKMLVLVSMATDGMIHLVSMYPEVWFMDSTAVSTYEFIYNMNPYFFLHMNSYILMSAY